MKILLVSGPDISLKEPYDSGIEAFLVSFANQLISDGHKVDVVAYEAENNAKFNLINPFSQSSPEQPDISKKLTEQMQFKNLDLDTYNVVHYNMFYPHLLEAGQEFNASSFLTLHSPTDDERISVYRKLVRESDLKFIAISGRVKKQWDSALNLDIPLIYNGIDVNIWSTKLEQPKYLLWSGRITEQKNTAAAICLAKEMQIPLKIAGRIVDEHYFVKQVEPHLNDQIQYVGHVTQKELMLLAKNAYAFLATATWQEPFGLAALEMLACGLPIVGFNTAVPPGWEHESVLTTPSLKWQDLVKLVHKSKDIPSESCKKFASNMTIQKMTSDYIKLYEKELISLKLDAAEALSTERNLETINSPI